MIRTFLIRSLPALVIAVFMALGSPQALLAQTTDDEQGGAPQTDWSEDELQSFASAAMAVDEVFTKWRTRIAEADTAEEANEMQQEASEEAVDAVEREGLTIEQYNEINQAIQADPELYDRVIEMIQAEQG